MGKTRLDLQIFLEELIKSRNVYFEAPPINEMQYPAIVYDLEKIENNFAENSVYKQSKAYQLDVIDKDSESYIVELLSNLPLCTFDRKYVYDNLYHYIYTFYY